MSSSSFEPDVELRVNEEVCLSTLYREDAETLFQLVDRNRSRLREWLPWLDWNKEVADSQTFIESSNQAAERRELLVTGIFHSDQLVGVMSLNTIHWMNRLTMIGYWIDKDQEGRGIITEATRTLTRHAFEDLGLNRVEIRCATANEKSQKVPERLGFQLEGVLRQAEWLYDRFVDHRVYSMLKSESERLRG